MPQHTIFLAHGVLGFSGLSLLPALPPITYFNGVASHLGRQGHTVIAPPVDPIASVRKRGKELGQAILAQLPTAGKVHIIAHSMGGLDARSALAHVDGLAERVATLVTIGTPHWGSPVADAVVDGIGPLVGKLPEFVRAWLKRNAGALHDLTTAACTAFDTATPDVPGVRYWQIAGNAAGGGYELLLFRLAAQIGGITGEVNDGVVTRASALRGRPPLCADWPVDHAGELGWGFAAALPFTRARQQHLARYDAIVSALR